ncbi:hypothetical protein LTR72_001164 [Exophiala xenobiotica]|nr:hypothetical protein LTR92_001859 [Exophiala xenobiotica]KAK5204928.1 hypothetical protein LTR41_009465 [Exophiala xenobiotica]KAK5229633.1 hypothetical protein LTR72_001164 [Exophiala xenobiotica]KAK5286619.1 hypothetical protein LTR14_009991 [Exophiala xenobiotica]KAK5326553.1 hypothetical protein LTR93_003416 [Exophiala xenobiotica]
MPSHAYMEEPPPPPYPYPYTSTSTSAGASASAKEESEVISRSLAWIPAPPSPSQSRQYPPLPVPVAIPQIQPATIMSGPMPFYRAYSNLLLQHSVSIEDFVHFIDSIDIALAPAPPFQVAQLASTGLGFVPHHWAQVASGAVGMAAGAGNAAFTAGRSRMFMNKVNQEFFAPRGLKASIKKDKDLNIMLGENPDQYHPPRIAPPGHSPAAVTVAERRLFALQGLVAPLTFEVPPPDAQRRNMMDRLTAKGVNRKIQKGRKDAVKAAQKQGVPYQNADMALLGNPYESSSSSSDSESDRHRPHKGKHGPKKATKKERDRSKKAARGDKKLAKKAGEQAKDDAKQAAKLSWIVIENLHPPQQQRHAQEYHHIGRGY